MAGINSKSIYLVHIAVFAVSDKRVVKAESCISDEMAWDRQKFAF